jgi:hypothetical protein
MPIKLSGSLTISDIVAEFGGTAPYDISDYYRGGGLVPNKNVNSNIPLAGSSQPIKFSQFYGATKIIELSYRLWGGGGAGGQGFENGAGSGSASPGQDSVIMTRTLYNQFKSAYPAGLPSLIGLNVTQSGTFIMPGILARASGGFGGNHGSIQSTSGGTGGSTDFGAGGSGGGANSAAPAAIWGRWGVGGGGGGGDQGDSSGWDLIPGIIGYKSVDAAGNAGGGGNSGSKVTGTIDLDVEVDYVIIAGRAGAPGVGVGNHNGGHGVPGVVEFTIDTTPGFEYGIIPAGDGSSITHRLTSTVRGFRLDRTGVPVFFDV